MKKNIIIMGIKHCGKSSLGKQVAEGLGYRFVDIDDLIEEKAGGLCIPDLYRLKGKCEFERLEAQAVVEFTGRAEAGGLPCVIAPGGGIIENSEAMRALEGSGYKVFLECHSYELYSRIIEKGNTALLDGDNPHEKFLKIFKKRSALYKRAADLIINIEGKTFKQALEKIERVLEGNGYVRK